MRTFALLLLWLFGLVACNQVANPTSTRIMVEWTTASEVQTAGFNIYRSDRVDGVYTKVNASLIPGSSDALVGGKYRFEDSSVLAGQTYYYQLEDVEVTGASTRHGPIMITAPPALDPGIFIAVFISACLLVTIGTFLYFRRRRRALGRVASSSDMT